MTREVLDLEYQRIGTDWLAKRARAGLADEQGLGKSFQAIRAADKVGATRIAVVCPAKMKPTWVQEFHDFGRPRAYRRFRVMSYEEAVPIFEGMANRGAGREGLEVLILDEAHYLKNAKTKRASAILPMTTRVPYVWPLTGTPMPNDASELWTLLYYLRPGLISTGMDGPMSFEQFRAQFCKLAPGYGGEPRVVGLKNTEQLKAILSLFWMRRKLADVQSQLPAMRYGEVIVETGDSNPVAVDSMFERITRRISRETYDRLVIEPDLLPRGDEELSTLRRQIAEIKAPALAAYLNEELGANPEEKIVIFSWHTNPIATLEKKLAAFGPVVVDGSTKHNDVFKNVRRFQTDPACRVFLGQIRAAGTGLTLTAASNVIFLDLSWTPADNAQAERRILRIGQTAESCLCRHVILKDSIDEAVTRALARKSRMISQLME